MKTILVFCFVLLGFTNLYSQDNKVDTSDIIVDHFTSGCGVKAPFDLTKYLTKNIVYPEDAKKNNIQGTVYVSFFIEKDGSVGNVKLLRGVNKSLDSEAIRVVSTMPKWIPGKQNGHPVKIQYCLPIHFVLNDSNSSNQKKN